MATRIGHASISERGTVNGTKGDQTGREVREQAWYSYPWDYIAIHPDATVREKHATAVEQACANNNIGYGQNDRNTLYALAKNVGYDLSKVGLCNCDCSSLQNVAAVASGSGAVYGSNGWTTHSWSMREALKKIGYKILSGNYVKSADYCVRGAIYVNETHHTACGLDNGAKSADTLQAAGITQKSSQTASSVKPAATSVKLETAQGYDKSAAGTYQTTANLNLRAGAGTGKALLTVMPAGVKVQWYGYYNEVAGVRWPIVQYAAGGTLYTGYCSSKYLKR